VYFPPAEFSCSVVIEDRTLREIASIAFEPDGKRILCSCVVQQDDDYVIVTGTTEVPHGPEFFEHTKLVKVIQEHTPLDRIIASHVCWSPDGNFIASAVHDTGYIEVWRRIKYTTGSDTVFERHKLNMSATFDIETDKVMSMQFKSGKTLFDLTLVIVAKHKVYNCTRIHVLHVCSGEEIVAPIKLMTSTDATADDPSVDTCMIGDGSTVVGATNNSSTLLIWNVTDRKDAHKLLETFHWYSEGGHRYSSVIKDLLGCLGFFAFDEFLHGEHIACLKKHASIKNLNLLLKTMFVLKTDKKAANHAGEFDTITYKCVVQHRYANG
jgi:WD40 repeat protein